MSLTCPSWEPMCLVTVLGPASRASVAKAAALGEPQSHDVQLAVCGLRTAFRGQMQFADERAVPVKGPLTLPLPPSILFLGSRAGKSNRSDLSVEEEGGGPSGGEV